MAHRADSVVGTGRPAGYTCLRAVRIANGMVVECASICLPFVSASGIPRCMVTYLHMPNELPRLAMGPNVRMTSDFKFPNWIDLGAGVPSEGDAP